MFGLAPSGLLEQGRDYALLGRVRSPRVRGTVLAAEVEGSGEVYAVGVDITGPEELGAPPAITPSCSCPSHRPFCRHVLALLFVWVWEPGRFEPVDAWERAMGCLPAPEAAAALARAAMGEADALSVLRQAAAEDWGAAPPGRCLQAWGAFREAALRASAWPQAALDLGRRIAGTPGSRAASDPAGVAVRQLAWWLTLVSGALPAPALLPWLRHLFALLEAAAPGRERPPAEVAVWLARLAVALPDERAAEARWIARFAADWGEAAPVFEAEVQRRLWEAEVTWRLAGGPAGAAPQPALRHARAVWRAFVGEEVPGIGSAAGP